MDHKECEQRLAERDEIIAEYEARLQHMERERAKYFDAWRRLEKRLQETNKGGGLNEYLLRQQARTIPSGIRRPRRIQSH